MPSSAPFRYRFTRLGMLLVGISVVLFLSSITSQSGLLLVPIGILAGCFLINIFSARRVLAELELRTPATSRAEENGRIDRGWIATNTGTAPIGGIAVDADSRELFVLPWIDAGQSVHPDPSKTHQRRGVYDHGDVIVRTRHPFGLVEVNRSQHLPGRTIVHPAVRPMAAPAASGYDVMVGGRYRGQRQSTSGDFFSGVREHRPGDSLRQIHWPSSAKGLGLMVRTYEEELSGRIAILLAPGENADLLDEGARIAASIGFAALDEGHHVEFVDLVSGRPELIPPFDDGQAFLDRLAALRTAETPVGEEQFRAAAEAVSRKAALHLVLCGGQDRFAASLDELESTGRKVIVHPVTEESA